MNFTEIKNCEKEFSASKTDSGQWNFLLWGIQKIWEKKLTFFLDSSIFKNLVWKFLCQEKKQKKGRNLPLFSIKNYFIFERNYSFMVQIFFWDLPLKVWDLRLFFTFFSPCFFVQYFEKEFLDYFYVDKLWNWTKTENFSRVNFSDPRLEKTFSNLNLLIS